MPKRIQRKRSRGWRMPAGAVYVGRPTKWGNPWSVGLARCGCRSAGECVHNVYRCATAEEAVENFRYRYGVDADAPAHFGAALRETARRELHGKHLVCWCPLDQPCHADVLLEIANETNGYSDN